MACNVSSFSVGGGERTTRHSNHHAYRDKRRDAFAMEE